jgi:FkbM family methyltransferase
MSAVPVERLERIEAAGFRWWTRPGTSDETAVDEVAVRRTYWRRDFHVEPGERWLDAGANMGAFAVPAVAAGAEVVCYEPWPESADLVRRNLRENGLRARVIEKAVALEGGVARLGIAKSVWRHSLLRTRGRGVSVPVVAFADAIAGMDAAKLDIEGAEIELLQRADDFGSLRKLVFEWHFDYERATDVYLATLDRLREHFDEVSGRKVKPGIDYVWFPPSAVVRCRR